ncbi:hypothetical protein MASR2M47_31820 [Draconibacterium sp.]
MGTNYLEEDFDHRVNYFLQLEKSRAYLIYALFSQKKAKTHLKEKLKDLMLAVEFIHPVEHNKNSKKYLLKDIDIPILIYRE